LKEAKMKNSLQLAALSIALLAASAAQAHKAWVLPSATVLSGNAPWITVDAAVSNDLFFLNHVPLRLDNLAIVAPDGSAAKAENAHTGKYRSVFDLQLSQTGTYRIAVVNAGLFANWEENGEAKRWRGTAETFATDVPKDAAKLQVTQSAGRIETFVTNGAPSSGALKPTGAGLELVPITHPNDLFSGESATFQLLIDGQPAASQPVEIVAGGTRYRDAQQEIKLTTGADGKFEVTWPAPGMYWLETSLQDDKASAPPATLRRASYVATLEVLPQ
jgi:uncharacterized GH25 family protein